ANDLFLNLFNNEDLSGKNLLDLIPADNAINNNFHNKFVNDILITRGGEAECRVSTKDGDVVWFNVSAKVFDENNILLNFIDVTSLKRTQAQLRRVTITDGTTGILNRQGIERLVIQKVEKALRDKNNLSLIIFDVDGFRRVNESLGYSEADRLLKVLSLSLKSVLSREDAIGRWGGDEFMVLTPKAGEPASYLADALRNMAKNFDSGTDAAITLSAGVAELGASDNNGVLIEDHAALIAAAYDAMILAKHKGGDMTCAVSFKQN
ncbi:MAG: diguanylate cyclase, partial [Synergistaceae bacterium]|nr:diguanylate cyclase [Synergistaceae bacterium]